MENRSTYSIVLSEKARKEVENAWLWYEDREQHLGDKFVAEVFSKLDKILSNPEAYSIKTKHFREAVVPIFPFVVLYKLNKRKRLIKIVSVFHTSQHPRKKRY